MSTTLFRYPKQWLKLYAIRWKVDTFEIQKLSTTFQLQFHAYKTKEKLQQRYIAGRQHFFKVYCGLQENGIKNSDSVYFQVSILPIDVGHDAS